MKKEILKNKKLFLLDMDGTIYLDNNLLDDSLNFLNYINSIGGKYIFLTNNSSKSVKDYILKLSEMGIYVEYSNFMTSSQATSMYLADKYNKEEIYVLGTKSLKRELREHCLNIVSEYSEKIQCLLVGYDTELTYSKLEDACKILTKRNVDYIATNPDLVCPTSFGFVPDCGSICNIIKIATGKIPKYIGKPNSNMVELAIRKSGFKKEETIVIGDRLYTDIACGLNARTSTALVLSGETKLNDLKNSEFKPEFVFKDISDIYNFLM